MITIIGAGKFGQCISKILEDKPHHIVDVEKDGNYSEETKKKIEQASHLIICVPSAFLESCARMIKPLTKPSVKIISCTKGLYENLETPTQILAKTLKNPLATLNGPNLSEEIMKDKPTITTIAGKFSEEWQSIITNEGFRVLIEEDPVGAEYGAATKNIVAIGAGILDGYCESKNAIGSFIALTLDELEVLYHKKYGRQLPRIGFIADLIATCISESSRNHQYGHALGKALKNKDRIPTPEGTIEGLRTLTILEKYLKKENLELKSIQALSEVLRGEKSVEKLIT